MSVTVIKTTSASPHSIAENPGAMFAHARCTSSARASAAATPAVTAFLIHGELPAQPPKPPRQPKGRKWPLETILMFNTRIQHMHILVLCGGNRDAAAALEEIMYWESPGKNGKRRADQEHDGKRWAAIGPSDWWKTMMMSPQTAKTITDKLEAWGLIETATYMFRHSKTTHYRTLEKAWMTPEQVYDLYSDSLAEIDPTLCPTGQTPLVEISECQGGPLVEISECDSLKSASGEGGHSLKSASNTTDSTSPTKSSTDSEDLQIHSPSLKPPGKVYPPHSQTKFTGEQGKTSQQQPHSPCSAAPPHGPKKDAMAALAETLAMQEAIRAGQAAQIDA